MQETNSFQTATHEMYIDGEGQQSTSISDVSTPESSLKGEDAVELILDKDPSLGKYIDRVIFDDTTTIQDILEQIQDIADSDGDENTDTSSIELSNANEGHLFIEQVADLTIPVSENDARIVIMSNGNTLLDNIYTPSLDGLVHLDLREFIYDNTAIVIPGHYTDPDNDNYMEQEASGLFLEISVTHGSTTDNYELWVNAFRSEALSRMSDVDRIDIPTDAIIPLSLYRDNNLSNAPFDIYLVSGSRRQRIYEGHIGDGDGYLVNTDIPVSRLPYRMGEPFFLEFVVAVNYTRDQYNQRHYTWRTVRTPIYRVTPAEAEQYIFLNDYGHFDIIPMHGSLTLTPEYDIQNAFRSLGVERAKATMHPLYTQNTGNLTRATAVALASLLLSRRIYHYAPGGSIRRIVVESPTLSISAKNSINTATFSWRYADNKQ